MQSEQNAKKSVRAQCIIQYYRKEIKDTLPMFFYYKPGIQTDVKRFYCFPALFSALFFDPTPEQIRFIGNEAKWLVWRRIPYLTERVMRRAGADTGKVDIEQWKACISEPGYDNGYRDLLICGSAHPNGYFREQCLTHFAEDSLFRMVEFTLIRLNDWVPEVRRTALKMLAAQMQRKDASEQFIEAIVFADRLRDCQRAAREPEFSMDRLDTMLMQYFDADAKHVVYAKTPNRKLCYKVFALHPKPEYRGLILHFFGKERDGELRCILERIYLEMSGSDVPANTLQMFMQDRNEHVRLTAYQYRVQRGGIWDGFEQLLMSESRRIRIFARNQLRKTGFDCLQFCRTHLPETLRALGDCGNAEDIALIRPYLNTNPYDALYALARLGAAERNSLLLSFMHSPDLPLAKAAYKLARTLRCLTPEELLPVIEKETDPRVLLRLVVLMTSGGIWPKMPFLIRSLHNYPQIHRDILYLIKKYTVRPVYITRELNQEIQKALAYAREGNHIPYDVNNQVFNVMKLRRD